MTGLKGKEKLLAEYAEQIKKVNELYKNGTAAEMEVATTELKKTESEYKSLLEKETFALCDTTHDAILKHHFETISHRVVREDGIPVGVEPANKDILIDMKKYCEYKEFELDWYYELQAFNKRLALRVARELKISEKRIKEIDTSYSMDKLAQEIALGRTPDSNNQCVKHMQTIIDKLDPDCGKVNNRDLSYVLNCYTKKGRSALKVVCSKHNLLMSILMDVWYRIATDSLYDVDCKIKEVKETEKKETEKSDTTKTGDDTLVVEREKENA